MSQSISTNYGLLGQQERDLGLPGELDATRHVELQRPGPDGYVNADEYNKQFADKLVGHKAGA